MMYPPDQRAAEIIAATYEHLRREFLQYTLKARQRFEERDFVGAYRDTQSRLELYEPCVQDALSLVKAELDFHRRPIVSWMLVKDSYRGIVHHWHDVELAMTFFNSVTRRMYINRGLDVGIEFYDEDFAFSEQSPDSVVYARYPWSCGLSNIVAAILGSCQFSNRLGGVKGAQGEISLAIRRALTEHERDTPLKAIDVLLPLFFRDGAAYAMGRLIWEDDFVVPLVIVFRHEKHGIVVDAVILDEDATSILFSFAHSYFLVAIPHHRGVVDFLKSMMPKKRIDELYVSLGHHKHGKTELHRSLRRHIARSDDRFEHAPGIKGMVMVVFTLPDYDVVFKVIRNRVKPPKRTSPAKVRQCYDLVFKHDRVGRLVDAQEFVYLEFHRSRFEPSLLNELLETADETVTVDGDIVRIAHLYTERRITPLNMYLRDSNLRDAQAALLDYGQAIKDLAAANIFAGDLFFKNFGVTRHGRVVFYDYDELMLLEECRFRTMPTPRYEFEVFESETWFRVAENDVFPEEFRSFLGIPRDLSEVFEREHGQIFSPEYWRQMQSEHAEGRIVEVRPYLPSFRLRRKIEPER